VRKILSTILLATLVLSVVAVAGVVPVRAATVGTLEVSTTQFWGNQIVQIRLYDPDLNVDPQQRDSAYVTITFPNGTQSLIYLNESVPNSGEFYAYISANDTSGVQYPPYGYTYNNYSLSTNFTCHLSKGDTIKLTYNDHSPVGTISQTLTYTPYVTANTDITFDKSPATYPENGYIRVMVKDFDWNFDPTKTEEIPLNISFTSTTNDIKWLNVTATETGPNTGVFRITASYNTTLSDAFADPKLNLTGFSGPVKVTYANETETTTAPFAYITITKLDRSLTSDRYFTTNSDLTVTVTDPNLDIRSWAKDNFTRFDGTNLTIITPYETETFYLEESAAASGTFKKTVPVVIGTPGSGDGILQVNGTFDVTIKYYFNGSLVKETVSSLSTTGASVSLDKSQYRATGKPVITITAPDWNDDPATINYAQCNIQTGRIEDQAVSLQGVNVGKLTVKVNGKVANTTAIQTLTFVESDVNTGVYKATTGLDLAQIKKEDGTFLANGDVIEVSYYDNINKVTSKATATIGVSAATISLDRDTIPTPRDKGVTVYITVNSPEDNKDSSTIQSGNATYIVYYYNNTPWNPGGTNVTLTETDVNTGIFEGSIKLNASDFSDDAIKALIGGKVVVYYFDPASQSNISATCSFRLTDASLSVDKSAVRVGETFTITVNDPDANVDSGSKDKVYVGYKYTLPDGSEKSDKWELTETGVNTGVFTLSQMVGYDIYVQPGTTISLNYNDTTPSTSTYQAGYSTIKYTASVSVPSTTGSVITDKTEYGIGSKMVVTVTDPDLNTDIYKKESYPDLVILRVSGKPDVYLTIQEDGLSSSTFVNKTYQWPNDASYIGKSFILYYKDEADANGNTVYISATGTIKSWDAKVQFEKSYYNVGDVVKVTVTDPDANRDPASVEVYNATVTSDSDPIGQTITLTETGANTGVFSGSVQLSGTIETGKVMAKYGDTLYAKYTDELPADYADTGNRKAFTGTAVVGVPVARPVPASSQKFVDPNTGAEKTSGTVGQAIGLQATVKNVDVVSKTFTAIFKVKDASGVTISISWVTGTLAPGQELTPGVSWTPSAAGTYTVEVLVVKTLAEPTPYSDIQTKTLTVS